MFLKSALFAAASAVVRTKGSYYRDQVQPPANARLSGVHMAISKKGKPSGTLPG